MAEQTVGALNILLNLELGKMQAQIDAANKRIGNMARKSHSDVATMAKRMNSALATIGVGVSVAGVISFGKSVIDLGGKITDLAAEAQIGTDAFQTLALAGMDSGVNMEMVAKASTSMRRAIGEAEDGAKQYTMAFERLGLNVQAFKTLAPERQFELLAQKIQGASDRGQAFNDAMALIGTRGGEKMKQFLDELGSKGLDELSKSFQNFKLDEKQLKRLDELGDKLARIWHITKVLADKTAGATIDAVGQVNQGAASSNMFGAMGAAAQGNLRISQANAPRGADAAKLALAQIDAEVAELKKKNPAQDQYNTSLSKILANGPIDSRTAEDKNKDIAEAKGLLIDYTKISKSVTDAMAKQDEEMAALVETTRRSIDPTREYKEQIAKVSVLQQAGKISAEEAAAAIGKLKLEMSAAQAAAVDSSLSSFFGDLDAQSKQFSDLTSMEKLWAEETMRIAGQAADGMTTAWVDALNGVEGAWGNLGDVVIKELEAMVVKMMIVIPTMKALGSVLNNIGGGAAGGGIWGSFVGALMNYGGGKASGGSVGSGMTYLVGEEGPELFTPSTSGNITPNGKLASITGGGGDTYQFTYNIPAGVTRAELLPALQETKRATIAEIRDMQRRGKA